MFPPPSSKPEIPLKSSFRIGEVSALLGISPAILRKWEQSFPRLNPQKNKSGHRCYSREDVEFLFQLRSLLRDRQFTIEGAQAVLEEGEKAFEAAVTGEPIEMPPEGEGRDGSQALRASLEATRRALHEAEQKAAAALHDVEFWKDSAKKAEARLAVLLDAVKALLVKMKGLSKNS